MQPCDDDLAHERDALDPMAPTDSGDYDYDLDLDDEADEAEDREYAEDDDYAEQLGDEDDEDDERYGFFFDEQDRAD
jgi:hypothetical protein